MNNKLEIPDPDPFVDGEVNSPLDGFVTIKILIDTLQRLVRDGKLFYTTVVLVKGKDRVFKGTQRPCFDYLGTMTRNDKGNLLGLVAHGDEPIFNGTEIPFG